jgi:sialidase-1
MKSENDNEQKEEQMIMKKLYFFLIAFFIAEFGFAQQEVNSELSLNINQYQVPVLVNKQNNTVLNLTLVSDSNTNTVLTQVNIGLKGKKGLDDINTVRVFVKNENKEIKFGKDQTPASEISFKDNYKFQNSLNLIVSIQLNHQADLSNQLFLTCNGLVTNKGLIESNPEFIPKPLRIGIAVRQHMDDNVHTYRIPGLTTTNQGTLLATYDIRRESGRDLQGDMDIGVSRSTDGGNSWEPMRIGLDMGEWGGLPEKFNGVSDACILVDENSDKIFLAGLWMHGVIDENGVWQEGLTEESTAWNHQWRNKGSQPGFGVKQTSQFLIATSSDDGKTWSEPVNITQMCKKEEWWLFAPAPGQGITLEDGTLVFPTQGRDKNGESFSNITYSKDGGETWTTSNPAFSNTTENMVVQLSDGSIMLNARYNENRNNKGDDNGRVVVTTTDLGNTWTEHSTSRSALIESTCMASIHKHVYHENGEQKSILLFSNPNTKTGRYNMTIKISFDDGKTWPEEYWMLLDEGRSFGYSCLTSVDENTIGILYEGSQAHMTFESIPLTELLHYNSFLKK